MDLKEFVIKHLKLINLFHRLNSLYRPIIFIEYFVVASIVVFTGLQILVVDEFYTLVRAIFHSMFALVDAAIYSYGSQRILDSSLSICDEAYLIDKNYILILMIAQKNLRFTTGLFEASLDTFCIMLSRILSFITLLKSFIK